MTTEITFTFTFTFTNREQYVQWRAEWRKKYAQLTIDIRKAKIDYKNDQRNGGYPSYYLHVGHLRAEASRMMLERMASKEESQRQYLASKVQEIKPDPSTIVSGMVTDAPEEFFANMH